MTTIPHVTVEAAPNAAPNADELAAFRTEDGKLLGKFDNVAAVVAAYKELEAKQGQNPQQQQQQQQTPAPEGDDPAKSALAAAGLDFAAFETEYATSGTLSQESIDKLVNSGIPRGVVDNYLAGIAAQSEKLTQELYAPFGGEAEVEKALAWAATGLTPEQVADYNKAFASNDATTVKMALGNLMSGFKAANPAAPKLNLGGGNPPTGPAAYASQAEIAKAVNDPRYKTDPAYRAAHEARLMKTDFGKLAVS